MGGVDDILGALEQAASTTLPPPPTAASDSDDTDSDDDTALLPGRETWVSQPEELAECYLHVRPADGDKWTKRYCIVHTDGRVAQYRSKTIRKRVLGEVCGWLWCRGWWWYPCAHAHPLRVRARLTVPILPRRGCHPWHRCWRLGPYEALRVYAALWHRPR